MAGAALTAFQRQREKSSSVGCNEIAAQAAFPLHLELHLPLLDAVKWKL
jgi:hypothetical protein